MNGITPAQIKVIETWTEQRDTLLREIGVYQTQYNDLKKSTTDAGSALAELHRQISESRGRLAELEALEERWRTSLSSDIAELEVRKSRLEGEVAVEEDKLKASKEKHVIVISSIDALSSAHDKMSDQAAIVNKVVGEVIETTQTHFSEVRGIFAEVKAISDEVITKGNENIKQTGIILDKLPRYIFELQRPIPVRRYVEALKGDKIDPEVIGEVKAHNAALKS